MEIELNRFTPAEQATFRLRALYEQAGYRKYRASRFEEYALYQEYQRFLPDAQVITFTDLDGKLRAIKPDVTLSTSGTARFSSPLGVDDFVKKSSFIYYTREALGEVQGRIANFAEHEGLHAHARSVTIRFEE